MKYSKRTTDYAKTYKMAPPELMYTALRAAGFNSTEAYITIFHPVSTASTVIGPAIANIEEKPGYNQALKFYLGTIKADGNGEKIRNKADAVEALEGLLSQGVALSDKVKVVTTLISLQQLNREDNSEIEQRVHYYLPLQCYRCDLYLRAKKSVRG